MQTSAPGALPQTCKAVVLMTAGYRFALPLNAIARILHESLLQQDPQVPDLVYFENQPLEQVYFNRLLSPISAAHAPVAQPFFVLVEVNQRRLAIAVDNPPVMMELPLTEVCEIPATYSRTLQGLARQMVTLDLTKASKTAAKTEGSTPGLMAGHLALGPQPSGRLSIFLLDLHQVIRRMDAIAVVPA